ncbi:MAG: hypothetical protein FD128_1827 [Hyphomonadaceae bacterium]|nr:MAG: hypothetical protein FD128_1827 [Hyphomonadaceae bacterium]
MHCFRNLNLCRLRVRASILPLLGFTNLKKLIHTSILAIFISGLAISGCAPIIDRHGFIAHDARAIEVAVGNDNKTTLTSRYGNPTQMGVFDEQVWYYISSTQSQRAFFKVKTTDRSITAISFDDDDKVSEVRQYAVNDGRIIDYSERQTPTRGREVTFLEQLFGSVGRSAVTLPGQDPNLPTAAGGPRTQ